MDCITKYSYFKRATVHSSLFSSLFVLENKFLKGRNITLKKVESYIKCFLSWRFQNNYFYYYWWLHDKARKYPRNKNRTIKERVVWVYMGKVTDALEANEDTCVCKKLILYLFISDFSLMLVHRPQRNVKNLTAQGQLIQV